MTAGRPPARKYSSPRYLPAGCMLTSSGISRPILSQSAMPSLTPAWRAIALMWIGAVVEPAVAQRAAGQHDRRKVDGRGRHQAGGRGLVATGHQHDAVERIAVEHLDEAQIGEIAVERRGRTLAGLLNRMHRELERDAAGVAN